jgi:hypothetical protein
MAHQIVHAMWRNPNMRSWMGCWVGYSISRWWVGGERRTSPSVRQAHALFCNVWLMAGCELDACGGHLIPIVAHAYCLMIPSCTASEPTSRPGSTSVGGIVSIVPLNLCMAPVCGTPQSVGCGLVAHLRSFPNMRHVSWNVCVVQLFSQQSGPAWLQVLGGQVEGALGGAAYDQEAAGGGAGQRGGATAGGRSLTLGADRRRGSGRVWSTFDVGRPARCHLLQLELVHVVESLEVRAAACPSHGAGACSCDVVTASLRHTKGAVDSGCGCGCK